LPVIASAPATGREAVIGGHDDIAAAGGRCLLAQHQLDDGLDGLGARIAEETRPCAPSRLSSFSARATSGSVQEQVGGVGDLATWLDTALTSAGCAWPSALTAMPAIRSRYSLPSTSQTRLP